MTRARVSVFPGYFRAMDSRARARAGVFKG